MKAPGFLLAFILTQFTLIAQPIEGDKMLQLIGKSPSDPLFLQFKQQENFITDAWNSGFTVYALIADNTINELEFQNGKLRYGSKDRYGYYKKPLPLGLNWQMSSSDFADVLGKHTFRSDAMNFNDYIKDEWKVRVFYEESRPVSVAFRVKVGASPAPVVSTQPVTTGQAGETKTISPQSIGPIIKLDGTGNAVLNWASFRQVFTSIKNLKQFAGNDSVDYIGQVYYSTNAKVEGFNRTAIKRRKANGKWFYEAFFKTSGDSNFARKVFFSLYDEIKKNIKDNTGDDFILASTAKKPISASPVNWIAQWTLYTNYKTLPAGLGKLKIGLMLSGMTVFMDKTKMEYTFKIYIFQDDLEWDFFTWDKPL